MKIFDAGKATQVSIYAAAHIEEEGRLETFLEGFYKALGVSMNSFSTKG